MQNDIFVNQELSRNIYVKRSQIISRIEHIRAMIQNAKFSGEIYYSFKTMHENLEHYKFRLNHVNQEIKNLEQSSFCFGG